MAIAEQLERVRKEKGLTQDDMANALNMSRITYRNIESGKRDLSFLEFEKIKGLLNITNQDFVAAHLRNYIESSKRLTQMIFYILNEYFPNGVTKVKLAKLLYLADFTRYYEECVSVSGSKYIRRKYGPVPDNFFDVIDCLFESEKISISHEGDSVLVRSKNPNASWDLLEYEDLEVMNRVCDYWKDKSTTEIVNFTHSQSPWQDCRDGEEIPYCLIHAEDPTNVYAPFV